MAAPDSIVRLCNKAAGTSFPAEFPRLNRIARSSQEAEGGHALHQPAPAGAIRFVQEGEDRAHLRGDGALVWTADWEAPPRRTREVQPLLRDLGRSLEAG